MASSVEGEIFEMCSLDDQYCTVWFYGCILLRVHSLARPLPENIGEVIFGARMNCHRTVEICRDFGRDIEQFQIGSHRESANDGQSPNAPRALGYSFGIF